MKVCNKCLASLPVTAFARNRAAQDGLQKRCRECSRADNRASYERNRDRHKQRYRDNHAEIRARQKRYRANHIDDYKAIADRYRASIEGRTKQLLQASMLRARRCCMVFALSEQRVKDALRRGVCERTGIAFDLEPHATLKINPMAPSLDRIDSFQGYTDENIQVVVAAYNIGKNQMSDEQFVWFCEQVVKSK